MENTDKTTRKRFALAFDEKNEIKDAHCYSHKMSSKLEHNIETQVQTWLDNNGIESPRLEFITKSQHDTPANCLCFQRSEVAYKSCANNWLIVHIAESGFWPRLISSKPKLIIQASSGEYVQFDNEIRSCNYSRKESNKCITAENLLRESRLNKRPQK